jgi:hypothetical protein
MAQSRRFRASGTRYLEGFVKAKKCILFSKALQQTIL